MFLLTTFVLYAFALQLVHALPIVKRIVVSPQITSPSMGTVWTPGDTEVVTWNTGDIPSTGDFPGMLVLGFLTPDSENLDLNNPLAQGFSLRDGSVSFTCPHVTPKDNYIVVLFGDSGNRSPPFAISGPPASSSSEPPASSSNQPQPSQIDPVQPQQASATPTATPTPTPTPSPAAPAAAAPDSGPSTPSSTPSTPVAQPAAVSTPASNTTPSTSSSKGSSASPAAASSSSAGSNSPAGNVNSNNAIPRTWNVGTMVACGVATGFMIFIF